MWSDFYPQHVAFALSLFFIFLDFTFFSMLLLYSETLHYFPNAIDPYPTSVCSYLPVSYSGKFSPKPGIHNSVMYGSSLIIPT